jgi:hypothetical protein
LAKTQEEKQKVIRDIQRFKMEARKYKGAIAPIRKISLKQSSIQTGEAFRVLRKDDGSKPMEGIFRFPGEKLPFEFLSYHQDDIFAVLFP